MSGPYNVDAERALLPAHRGDPFLHVDLDAFYANVEILKDRSLAAKPVVVGNAGPRGVVVSASYEARARGLRAGMPSVRARRLCPEAIFVRPDFETYRMYSNRFREIMLSFTPLVEPVALDEAFLDVSGATLLFGAPDRIARRIRTSVRSELELPVSVGGGASKLVAKLASTRAKPDGMLLVSADRTISFIHQLPVSALWGVGEKTAAVLGKLGIDTVAELSATPRVILERAVGESQARALLDLSNGRDDRPVVPYEAPKSVGHEQTYSRDLDNDEEILREVLSLSHRLGAKLREEGYRARTITLKARLPSFATFTRSSTLPTPTDVGSEIYNAARTLLARLGQRRFRLLGVTASALVPSGAEQLALVGTAHWQQAERALDRVEKRFGAGAATPASLLERKTP